MDLLLNPEINFCSCGCETRIIKHGLNSQKSGKKRYQYWIECLDDSCGNKGGTEAQSWKAILNWNSSEHSDFPDYVEIPFLSFIGLSKEEIATKISALESELQTKANKSYKSGRPLPQKAYIELKAQLAWIDYAKIWFGNHFNCTESFANKKPNKPQKNSGDKSTPQTN
ncbi:MAG: hypothetical protein KUG83_10970 [Gammaproteobacteria bacterium]|nr:hypothetical protein [Gammaproteobacteria bacterium]